VAYPPIPPPVRAALIGAGQIASEHLACLASRPDVVLVGVCDRSAVAAEAAATRHGGERWFTDHREMLAQVAPDVVHVTTPAPSHPALAADALDAGAHVLVEKPLAPKREDVTALLERARTADRHLVEDHNYVWDPAVQRILALIADGSLGEVVHAQVDLFLDLASEDSAYADPNLPHPALFTPGGAIGEFLTHLASLAHAFTGPHGDVRTVWESRRPGGPLPHDELRALVTGPAASAAICFSARARPAAFSVRVAGTRMRATASLFDSRLLVVRERAGSRPLASLIAGLAEGRDAAGATVGSLWARLQGGPGSYRGLWNLIGALYDALRDGHPPPVGSEQVAEANRLVFDLIDERNRL
jgi:predicted dehydrogenase